MSFADWLRKQTPTWFRNTNGDALWKQTGAMLDKQTDLLLQGVLSRFPTKGSLDNVTDPVNPAYALPADDALTAQGFDRQLPRGPGETSAAYSARLQAAWDAWHYGGSHWGVLQALRLAGFTGPTAYVVQDNGRFVRLTGSAGLPADMTFGTLSVCADSGRPGWVFDTRRDFFSRFALVYTSMPAGAGALNTSAGQSAQNTIVRAWKPSEAIFAGTYVITGARIWGFSASPPALPTWGTGNWGGSSTFIGPDL
jgi:hypothetical protein